MELATEIYKRMRTVKDVTRKDIIEQFIAEGKLTKAGASTYYQLIKKISTNRRTKSDSADAVCVGKGSRESLS